MKLQRPYFLSAQAKINKSLMTDPRFMESLWEHKFVHTRGGHFHTLGS